MKNKSDYQELDFNSLIAYEVGTAMGFIGHALYFLDNRQITCHRIYENSEDEAKQQLDKIKINFKIARFGKLGERFFIKKDIKYTVDKKNLQFVIFKNNKKYQIEPENRVFFGNGYQIEICEAWINYLRINEMMFENKDSYQYELKEALRKLEELGSSKVHE